MSFHFSKLFAILALLLAALLIGGQFINPSIAQTLPSTSSTAGASHILLLASDICKHDLGGTDYTPNCKKTGDIIRSVIASNPGAQVQTAGDNVNNEPPPASYDAEYTDVYAPNWGSFLAVTHAAIGNHDRLPPGGAAPYFSYFGSTAGAAPGGYYSYNIGTSWHVIVLNSICSSAGGCGPGSAQYTWLKNDLASNSSQCILAVWHHPRFSSGQFGGFTISAPWWDLLYQYKADIVASGHNHTYERYNLIDPSGQAASDGIREFLVGTGGAPGPDFTYAEHPLDPNEAVRNQTDLYGVLQLTLSNSSYAWNFLPAPGYSFTDSGTTDCHAKPQSNPTAPESLTPTYTVTQTTTDTHTPTLTYTFTDTFTSILTHTRTSIQTPSKTITGTPTLPVLDTPKEPGMATRTPAQLPPLFIIYLPRVFR